MCVTVCGTTTNIGFYDVELGDNSIRYIRISGYQTKNDLKINEISEHIFKLQSQMMLDLIIIDSRAFGIAIADELEKRICKTPIYKAYITKQIMNEGIIRTRDIIKDSMYEVNDININIDMDNFNIIYNADNYTVSLAKSNYDDIFSNICFVFGFGYSVLSDMLKIDKREKIETNLNEILWILIDDIKNIKCLDTKEIEKLTRLIDKVNYIRGQY